MTVVQISTAPSRDLYDKVSKHVGLDASLPAGLISHAAAELPDGTVQIVQVFDSREQLEAFGRDRMMPAFAAAGAMEEAMADGPPVAYEAFHVVP